MPDRQRPDPRPEIELDLEDIALDPIESEEPVSPAPPPVPVEPRPAPSSAGPPARASATAHQPSATPPETETEESAADITSRPSPPHRPPAAAAPFQPALRQGNLPGDLPDALNIDLRLRKLQNVLRLVGISLALLIVLALVIIYSIFALRDPTSDSADRPAPSGAAESADRQLPPVFVTQNLGRMRAAAEKFFAADNIAQLVKYCRDVGRVRPLIEDHYSRNPLEPVGILQFALGDNIVLERDVQSGNHFSYVSLETTDYRVRTICIELVDNEFKVDWESAVGYSEMNWDQFLEERPSRPVTMRIIGVLTDYYNYEYSDPAAWVSLKISNLLDSHELYGFVRRNSPPHATIQRILKNAPQVWLVARLRFPENARSRNCVEIVEIIHDRWVMGLAVDPPLPSPPERSTLDGGLSPRQGGQDLNF